MSGEDAAALDAAYGPADENGVRALLGHRHLRNSRPPWPDALTTTSPTWRCIWRPRPSPPAGRAWRPPLPEPQDLDSAAAMLSAAARRA